MIVTPLVRTLLASTAVAALATACGTSSTPPVGAKPSSSADTITIKDFAYNDLTVKPGATVTVINKDAPAHTVTSDDKTSFDTKVLAKDATTTFTAPSAAGSYTYYCTIHTYMKGTLTVSAG